MRYTVVEVDGELVRLTRPQREVLEQAARSSGVQANHLCLRALERMGFVTNVAYAVRDQKPFADFTAKAKRINWKPVSTGAYPAGVTSMARSLVGATVARWAGLRSNEGVSHGMRAR